MSGDEDAGRRLHSNRRCQRKRLEGSSGVRQYIPMQPETHLNLEATVPVREVDAVCIDDVPVTLTSWSVVKTAPRSIPRLLTGIEGATNRRDG